MKVCQLISGILLFFLLHFPVNTYAQESVAAFDSIMSIMQDKSIPLLYRYYMTGEINNFKRDHQIEIIKSIIPEAKEYDDKAVITRLYALIAQLNTMLGNLHEAQNYIDSTFIYKDKFDNVVISGLMYYVKGVFHSNRNEMAEAHKAYYKAVEYFDSKGQKLPIMSDIYYNLSIIYFLWNDDNALNELRNNIEEVPVVMPAQPIMTYSIHASYYYALYKKEYSAHFLDSVTKYNMLAIDYYHEEECPYDIGYQVSTNYMSQSIVYSYMGKIKEARYFFEEGKRLASPNNIHTNFQARLLSGLLNYYEDKYDLAEKELLEGVKMIEQLTENSKLDFYHLLTEYYDALATLYEEKGQYNKSLEMARNSLTYEKRLFDKENTTIIQDMRAKYNLDQKEKAVQQLSIMNERGRKINLLTFLIIVLCLIVIVLLFIRFRMNKRMSKNKLQIAELKQQETELMVELQKFKLDEKEKLFQSLVRETEQRRIKSYLEGLETERKRLARNLHDNVSNEIVAIKMKLEDCKTSREDILEILLKLHTEVRGISHELIPPVFQYATLQEILEDYVDQRSKLSNIEIKLNFNPAEGWEAVPQNICLDVYRIIQEATGNALKYANASQVIITLTMNSRELVVSIQDNGSGFDIQKVHRGIGLRLIRERAEGVNGEVNLRSEIGKGTWLEIIVPLLE